MKHKINVYDMRVPPYELLGALVPDQISFLDPVRHVSDPDPNSFVDTFYIAQIPHDCDYK